MEKKFENEIYQWDKRASSGVHDTSKEFGLMIREKLQEFAMILVKKYHYNFPVEYFDDYHGSFNKEEFLGVEKPKEETRLQTTDSLPILDFGQKKKHFDRAADQKEPTDLFDEQIIPHDAPTKRLQGNIREAIDEVIEEAKANSLPPVASAWAEGFGTAPDQRFVGNGTTLDQTNQTKGPAIDADDGAKAFPQILDLSKSEEQSNLEQNMDLTWVKIGNEEVKTTLARGKLRDIAKGVEGFVEENKIIAIVLVFALTGKSKLLSIAFRDESLAGIEVAAIPNANAHKQPWYEYPRQVYNPPLLHFEDDVDIYAAKHGCGLKGKTITATMDVDLPPLLVLDNNELLMEVMDTDSLYVGLQVSATKYVCLKIVDYVHKWETKLDWISIIGSSYFRLELDEVFPIEVLSQLRLGIDLRNLRMKMKRPRRRKKER